MGRFHEREVGPHPRWSYQIAFAPTQFSDVVGWLALNHGALDVFVHPNTDNELRDQRDGAPWLGRSYQLNLTAVGGWGRSRHIAHLRYRPFWRPHGTIADRQAAVGR